MPLDKPPYSCHGVSWCGLKHNGIEHYLGTYDTEQEAHDAAYKEAQQMHGAFVNKG